jgi:hypothetical protein
VVSTTEIDAASMKSASLRRASLTQSLFILPALFLSLVFIACDETHSRDLHPAQQQEQDLAITLGGFVQNGPQDQLLDGQCTPDPTRTALECDIHNGLMDWNITEVTFQVIPIGDDAHHYYREQLSIASLQTEHVTIKLGMQLLPDDQIKVRGRPIGKPQSHWGWLVVGAKGERNK